MAGAFQTSREIFENPLWKNIVEFRLFFLIYGMAVFSEEGYRMADDLFLQRGEWCRSIRKIQEDLTYIENRQVKTYSVSVIQRAILSHVKAQRICTRMHKLGTVFTVVNYEQYQRFDSYKKKELGTELGTVLEQTRVNNKKVKKVKKDINKDKTYYGDFVQMTLTQHTKLVKDLGLEVTQKYILNIDDWFAQDPRRLKNYSDHSRMVRTWKRKDDEKFKLLEGGKTNAKHGSGHAGRTDAELDAMSL